MDRDALVREFNGYMAGRMSEIAPDVLADRGRLRPFSMACGAKWARQNGHDVSKFMYPPTAKGLDNVEANHVIFLDNLPSLFSGREESAREAFPHFLIAARRDFGSVVVAGVHDTIHEALWDFACDFVSRKLDREWNSYSKARKGLDAVSDGPVD